MRTYRERSTGQEVELTEPPWYLDDLARWERIDEVPEDERPVAYNVAGHLGTVDADGPIVPFDDAPPAENPVLGAAHVDAGQVDSTAAAAEAEPPAAGDMPNKGSSRDLWAEWALAHGKTEADLDGIKRDEIASWFLTA